MLRRLSIGTLRLVAALGLAVVAADAFEDSNYLT
jgi:hypothetical protein